MGEAIITRRGSGSLKIKNGYMDEMYSTYANDLKGNLYVAIAEEYDGEAWDSDYDGAETGFIINDYFSIKMETATNAFNCVLTTTDKEIQKTVSVEWQGELPELKYINKIDDYNYVFHVDVYSNVSGSWMHQNGMYHIHINPETYEMTVYTVNRTFRNGDVHSKGILISKVYSDDSVDGYICYARRTDVASYVNFWGIVISKDNKTVITREWVENSSHSAYFDNEIFSDGFSKYAKIPHSTGSYYAVVSLYLNTSNASVTWGYNSSAIATINSGTDVGIPRFSTVVNGNYLYVGNVTTGNAVNLVRISLNSPEITPLMSGFSSAISPNVVYYPAYFDAENNKIRMLCNYSRGLFEINLNDYTVTAINTPSNFTNSFPISDLATYKAYHHTENGYFYTARLNIDNNVANVAYSHIWMKISSDYNPETIEMRTGTISLPAKYKNSSSHYTKIWFTTKYGKDVLICLFWMTSGSTNVARGPYWYIYDIIEDRLVGLETISEFVEYPKTTSSSVNFYNIKSADANGYIYTYFNTSFIAPYEKAYKIKYEEFIRIQEATRETGSDGILLNVATNSKKGKVSRI